MKTKTTQNTSNGDEGISEETYQHFTGYLDPPQIKLETPHSDISPYSDNGLVSAKIITHIKQEFNSEEIFSEAKRSEWFTEVKQEVDEASTSSSYEMLVDQNEEEECKINIEACKLYKSEPTLCDDAQENVKSNLHDNHSIDIYKCTQCNYTTKHRQNLSKHVRVKHDLSAVVYKCADCDFTTKTKGVLLRHAEAKHVPKKLLYKCAYCRHTTRKKEALRMHVRTKHAPKQSVYKSNERSHVKVTHNPNVDLFKCGQCEYTSKNKYNLQSHMRNKHDTNANSYKCTHCEYTSKNKYNFQSHVKLKHDLNANIYKCAECKYTSKSKYHFQSHVRIKHHPNLDSYKCADCGAKGKDCVVHLRQGRLVETGVDDAEIGDKAMAENREKDAKLSVSVKEELEWACENNLDEANQRYNLGNDATKAELKDYSEGPEINQDDKSSCLKKFEHADVHLKLEHDQKDCGDFARQDKEVITELSPPSDDKINQEVERNTNRQIELNHESKCDDEKMLVGSDNSGSEGIVGAFQ